jgi:alpha/beta superfamily hydrolase
MLNYNNTTKEFFNTSESKISAEFNNVPTDEQGDRIGILFIGSNPQWPGSENNKILNNMFYDFSKKKYCVMKVVCKPYDSVLFKKNDYKDIKYVRDISVVIDCFFSKFSCVKYFVILGYSWGASIAFNILLRRPEISSFILISPTLSLKQCDFTSSLSIFKTNGLIIHGEKDEITPLETLNTFSKLLESKKFNIKTEIIHKANHYYTDGYEELLKIIEDYLENVKDNSPIFSQKDTIKNL